MNRQIFSVEDVVGKCNKEEAVQTVGWKFQVEH